MTPTVLYIEDHPDNMTLVRRILHSENYILIEAKTGFQGIFIAENEDVDVILLDINLPDVDGHEVARRLRASKKAILANIPIVAVTANAMKGDDQRVFDAGVDVYISKPFNIQELLNIVEGLVNKAIKRYQIMTNNILCIEDNPDNMALVRRVLEARGYNLLQAATGIKGVEVAESEAVDLILLDINLPDINGFEVARRLRLNSKRELRVIPIIAVTANALKGDADKALASGCDVYMSKPINIRELWARVEAFVPPP